jgi:hypothetical protein
MSAIALIERQQKNGRKGAVNEGDPSRSDGRKQEWKKRQIRRER